MQDAVGFDNDKYLQEQTAAILDRVSRFGKSCTWSSKPCSTTMPPGSRRL